jgi:hypothetical protein
LKCCSDPCLAIAAQQQSDMYYSHDSCMTDFRASLQKVPPLACQATLGAPSQLNFMCSSVPADTEVLERRHTASFLAPILSLETLPNLRAIGDSAFSERFTLESVSIPPSAGLLGHRYFASCGVLRTVLFSPGSLLTTNGDCCLLGCWMLRSISIPSSGALFSQSCFAQRFPAGSGLL